MLFCILHFSVNPDMKLLALPQGSSRAEMAAEPIALGNFPRALDMSYLSLLRNSGCQESALLHSPWPEDAPGYGSWTKQPSGRLRPERGFMTSSGPIPLLTLSCCTRSGGPGASTACSRWKSQGARARAQSWHAPCWRVLCLQPLTADGALHLPLNLRCWRLLSFLILLLVWGSLPLFLVCWITFQLSANIPL